MNTSRLTKDIQQALSMRQNLLRQYWKLSGLTPEQGPDPLSQRLNQFLGQLIDYTAHGHFSLYEKLFSNITQTKQKSQKAINSIYHKILTTTHELVDLHDHHQKCEDQAQHTNMAQLLSQIGELIASRFDLEDQLLSAVQPHNA